MTHSYSVASYLPSGGLDLLFFGLSRLHSRTQPTQLYRRSSKLLREGATFLQALNCLGIGELLGCYRVAV